MLASQLLYTSWKNGKSTIKGYMTYSKSKDITDIEEQEINAVMKYKAPNYLPYTPGNEEIEALFPKKFAYFKLSSGRFCIAQSSYIGQDYTNRWGNYIIHAYVLNDLGNLVPSKMIGADIFRKRLTEEELNADFAPESLPQVDVEYPGNALTEQEIKQFFDTVSKKNMLKVLAQSACDSVLNNRHISFIDNLSNMRMWITALSMVVPKSILDQVYFSTYATEDSNLITLACKDSVNYSNAYSQMYVPNDFICIDANRNIINADTISYYIDGVCNKLFNEYCDVISCANRVNKIMKDYDCKNYDLAYKVAYVKEGKLDYILSNEELVNTIELVIKHETDDLSKVFDEIFCQYSISKMYTGDACSIAVLKLLYPYITAKAKLELMMMYIDKKFEKNIDPVTLYKEIKRDCPCAWNEAVMYFLRQSFSEHLEQNLSNGVSLLLSDSWISVYKSCSKEQKQLATEKINSLYIKLVANHDMQSIMFILDACKSVDEQLYFDVYKSVCKINKCFGEDDNYLFEYLKLSLDNGDMFWSILLHELNCFPADAQQYIKHFIDLQVKYPMQTDYLKRYADKDQSIHQFFDNVNVYRFEHEQLNNFDSLIDCYTKFIANNTGDRKNVDRYREIFIQKARIFLKNCDGEESIRYSINLYDNLYRGKKLVEADKEILELLLDIIYNDNKKDIEFINKSFSKIPFEIILAFINSCKSIGLSINPRALLICEGQLLEKATNNDDRLSKLQLQKMFREDQFTFLKIQYNTSLIKEFLDSYIDVMLKGMYIINKGNNGNNSLELIDYFLVPIYKGYSNFNNYVIRSWKNNIDITNDNMKMYFTYIFKKTNSFSKELKNLVDEYLVYIGKGRRNALFEELTNYFKKSYNNSYYREIDMYIKDFNKNHMNFFDKFKNIFSVKEVDKSNVKKK